MSLFFFSSIQSIDKQCRIRRDAKRTAKETRIGIEFGILLRILQTFLKMRRAMHLELVSKTFIAAESA